TSSSSLFLTHPAATAIYTLSLHDALPIFEFRSHRRGLAVLLRVFGAIAGGVPVLAERAAPLRARRRAALVRAQERFGAGARQQRSEEHTSELQSRENLVCRLLLEKKKTTK